MNSMRTFQAEEHTELYSACRSIVGPEIWDRLVRNGNSSNGPESLIESLIQSGGQGVPLFLPELARLEWTIGAVLEVITTSGTI